MPSRAGSACSRPGCGGIVRAGVCSVCGPRRAEYRRTEDAQRGTPAERGYDEQWRKVRAMALAGNPLCKMCADAGATNLAADVHHIVPIRVDPSRRLDLANLVPLCRRHHAQAERATIASNGEG
jgi:5-methylcytosine-specific restriction protein A